MVRVWPLTDELLAALAHPPSTSTSAVQTHSLSARPPARGNLRMPARLAPATGQVREQVANPDGDQDQRDPDQDRVKPAGEADRPEHDPEAQAKGGGENQTHCGRDASD